MTIPVFLAKKLVENERNRITQCLISLVQRNREMQPGRPDGYWVDGQYYSDLPANMTWKGDKGTLHAALRNEHREIIQQSLNINKDADRIRQSLAILLFSAKSYQDMRDALPDGLAELHPEISKLRRTREEAYLLKQDSLPYQRYMKIRPLIDFYLGMRAIS